MDRLVFLCVGMIIGAVLVKGTMKRREQEAELGILRKAAAAQ